MGYSRNSPKGASAKVYLYVDERKEELVAIKTFPVEYEVSIRKILT